MAQAAPTIGGTPRAAASLTLGLGVLFLCSFFISPVTIETENMAAEVRRITMAAQGSPATSSHAQAQAHGAGSAVEGSFSQGGASRGLQEVQGQKELGKRGQGGGKEGKEGGAAGSGRTEVATFAAGCFWSVELAFQRVPGVTKVRATVRHTQGTTLGCLSTSPGFQRVPGGPKLGGTVGHTQGTTLGCSSISSRLLRHHTGVLVPPLWGACPPPKASPVGMHPIVLRILGVPKGPGT